MSAAEFCVRCGAARAAGARFCTACGAPLAGRPAPAPTGVPVPAIALGALLLIAGGVAAWFAMQEPAEVARAVPGVATGGAAAGTGAAAPEGGLPSGHPSIELPKEVLDFLDNLTAEAAADPQSVDAAQRLARARYRASVINASYRRPAEQSLDKLLALDPANVEGLRIRANLAYDAGRFVEATKHFEDFLAKHPDDVSAMTDLGSALLFQDRNDDAIAKYRQAIAKDPKFMQAHFNIGIALQRQGKTDDAIASLRRAVELAETPQEKQQVENALAELEKREPRQFAAARAASPDAVKTTAPPAAGAAAAAAKPGGATPAAAAPGAAAPQGGQMQGGMAMPPPAPDREVPTNASSAFQRQAEKPLITHPMIGPRVVAFEWLAPSAARVKIADFPMDQMPPFARTKFKSSMAEKLLAIASQNGVAGPVTVELVDNASGKVMEKLDTAADAARPAQ